ncbi:MULTISPECIES: hypothetical protein [unclassified Marinovum]
MVALVLTLWCSLAMPGSAKRRYFDVHQPLCGVLDQLTKKIVRRVRIPVYPPTYSDNIRPPVPGYPPTFDALP